MTIVLLILIDFKARLEVSIILSGTYLYILKKRIVVLA